MILDYLLDLFAYAIAICVVVTVLQVFSAAVAAVFVSGTGGIVDISDLHAGSSGSQSYVGGNGES